MSHSARHRRRGGGMGPAQYILLGLLVLLLLGAMAGARAPPLSALKQKQVGSPSAVYAADGTRLGFIQADELREPIDSNEIPDVLKQAPAAIEDQRFYKH